MGSRSAYFAQRPGREVFDRLDRQLCPPAAARGGTATADSAQVHSNYTARSVSGEAAQLHAKLSGRRCWAARAAARYALIALARVDNATKIGSTRRRMPPWRGAPVDPSAHSTITDAVAAERVMSARRAIDRAGERFQFHRRLQAEQADDRV